MAFLSIETGTVRRDTVLAATPIREYPPVEDLAVWKKQLLTQLTPEQLEFRAEFFTQLTEWMMTL